MIELTTHQDRILSELLRDINANINDLDTVFFMLSGKAGTGKTTVTRHLANRLIKFGGHINNVKITATTHQACNVLREASKFEVTTINSLLRMKPTYQSEKLELKAHDLHKIDRINFLIIDEASMLTKNVVDGIMQYVKARNVYLKVILVGDNTQLILEPETLSELNLDGHTHYLEKPMRANELSDIYRYGKEASQAIKAGNPPPPVPFSMFGEIMRYDNHKDFINAWKYTKENIVDDPYDMKILCYTNNQVKHYNNNIMKLYYGQSTPYAVGNIITTRSLIKTSVHQKINNNMRITITDVKKVDNVEFEYNKRLGIDIKIPAYEIKVREYPGSFYIAKSKADIEKITKPARDRKDWKNYFFMKERFGIIQHAEAGTVHSSQGETLKEVFIDATDINKARTADQKARLAYVAITRAIDRVHIFTGKEREYKHFMK